MSAIVHHGVVDGDGRLLLDPVKGVDGRKAFAINVAKFTGKRVVVIVKDPTDQRTLKQNAYLHAEPFKKIAEAMGCSVPEAKLDLMGECWGWKEAKASGNLVPVKPSTSSMSKADAQHFIDWVIPWAAEFFGYREDNGKPKVDIMPPKQWHEANPDISEAYGDEE